MRRQKASSVFLSLRLTVPANVEKSSKCLRKAASVHVYVLFSSCSALECMKMCSKNNSLCLSSAFKACHPKVKSFYFAADGVDDMNR